MAHGFWVFWDDEWGLPAARTFKAIAARQRWSLAKPSVLDEVQATCWMLINHIPILIHILWSELTLLTTWTLTLVESVVEASKIWSLSPQQLDWYCGLWGASFVWSCFLLAPLTVNVKHILGQYQRCDDYLGFPWLSTISWKIPPTRLITLW